ncbi:UNVERIFIED_CONTAM: hypothetical protein FKN15_039915 [Acipenser sinensis]
MATGVEMRGVLLCFLVGVFVLGNTAVVQEVQKFVASATGEGLDEFNMVASQGQASSGSTPGSVQDSLFHMALALLGVLLFVLPAI